MKNNNIFVSIASYRDDVLINTIENLYQNAKYPNSIFIGICQQNNNKIDKDGVYDLKSYYHHLYKNNIRIIRIPYYDARGPYHARYLCASLIDLNNESYFFQIDSHTTFIKDWDECLINMYNEIIKLGLSKKPIISYYPKDINCQYNEEDEHIHQVPVFDTVIWKKEKGVFILSSAIYRYTNDSYIKTPYSAAGMIFSSSSLIEDVPFNSCLSNLFDGEEIYNSIRFYLNDYDIFIPKVNVIYHEYLRNDKFKFWDEPLCNYDDTNVTSIINKFLFDFDLKGKTNRTLKDYYKFANIDINKYYWQNLFFSNFILLIIIIVIIIIILILVTWFYIFRAN